MTAEDLNLILEIGLEISETDIKPYLFLDEIQNINGGEVRSQNCRYEVSNQYYRQ